MGGAPLWHTKLVVLMFEKLAPGFGLIGVLPKAAIEAANLHHNHPKELCFA